MKIQFLALLFAMTALTACSTSPKEEPLAEIITKEVPYTYNGTQMIGYVAIPKTEGKKPGVLVVHEWWGQTEYPRARAERLAREGYVAMAVDMFGERSIADHPKEAKGFVEKSMKNHKDTEGRFNEALKTLKDMEEVDPKKTAALGYCYGGSLALEMARRGADLDMVFSYHGSVEGVTKAAKGKVKGKLYVFNGGSDPMVKASQVEAFKKEMDKAEVSYVFYEYPDAKHAFTNPNATELGKKFELPLEYNEQADDDSWTKTLDALETL